MQGNYRKLRIGVMTDGDTVPAWANTMLAAISNSDHCELVLHIKNGSGSGTQSGLFSKLWKQRSHLLLYFYELLDAKLFGGGSNAFGPKKLTELWYDLPQITVNPIKKKFTDRISDDDIRSIRSHEPDVLIRLGFRILTGEILTVATQGVWSYHHADNRVNRGGPAGFWEFFLNQGTTGVTLQKLTEALDDGVVIDRSSTSTNRFSYARNRNALYWRSVMMLPRQLDKLALLGPDAFWNETRKHNDGLSCYSAPLYKAPTNWPFLKLLWKKSWKIAVERVFLTFNVRQWILLYRFSRSVPHLSFFGYKRILPPKDRIWADPFLHHRDGKTYVFLEEMPFKTELGHISVMELSKSGRSKPEAIIKQPYHMSFPFLMEWNGRLYMIPETAKNNCIEYYECVEFPKKWEKKGELMTNVVAMDTVLIERDGTWFLFTTIVSPKGASSWDELHLYYADEPLGKAWQEHPQSPVVTDVRKARMAGDFFERNGDLYRPSQNCSGHYGSGMTINRVKVLTRTDYVEEEVDSISANWADDLHSTHTLNCSESLTIIDAQIHRRRIF